MWLVVGLGNPGEKYAHTRHNVGFMVVDAMAQKSGASFQNAFKAEVSKITSKADSLLLLKPQTFMNLSGESVQAASQFHKISRERVIVIHDELDLPFGDVRVKFDGGAGGHNGIRDVIRVIGPAFIRIRIGVGRPSFKGQEADYVLKDYKKNELDILAEQIVVASEAVHSIVNEGLQKAQMFYNQKHSPLAKKV